MFTSISAFVRNLFSKRKASEKQQPVVKIDPLNLDQPKKVSKDNGLDSCAHTYACGARMYLGNRKS
jgi:hypothetical protein